MQATPDQELFYKQEFDRFMSIPDDKTYSLTMPHDEAAAEAERVLALVEQDMAKHRAAGVKSEYLDTLNSRVGAFIWSLVQVDTYVELKMSTEATWREKKKEAEDLRLLLIRAFLWAFREDPKLLGVVENIKQGKGDRDLILDLLAEYKLGKENIPLLQAINLELALVDQSQTLYNEMVQLYTGMQINPEEVREMNRIRNKAWTHLKIALDEIYEAGRFIYPPGHERHELYYNDYLRRMGKTSSEGKTPTTEIDAATAIS
jgi:hypothetical protein